jgi:hypothetical protein
MDMTRSLAAWRKRPIPSHAHLNMRKKHPRVYTHTCNDQGARFLWCKIGQRWKYALLGRVQHQESARAPYLNKEARASLSAVSKRRWNSFLLCVARGGRINSSRDSCICTTHDWPLLRAHSVLYVCVWLIIYLWICECGRVQSARLRLRPRLPKSLLWRDNCTHAADEHLYDLCVVKVAKCIHSALWWRITLDVIIASFR